jgi:hypothetical protein
MSKKLEEQENNTCVNCGESIDIEDEEIFVGYCEDCDDWNICTNCGYCSECTDGGEIYAKLSEKRARELEKYITKTIQGKTKSKSKSKSKLKANKKSKKAKK